METQEIILTMHTLNKYGIPCTDVTDYDIPSSGGMSGEASVLYIQNVPSTVIIHSKMKSTSYEEPEIPEDENPATGIFGFLYSDFHDSQVDYYSLQTGKFVCTGTLPAKLVNNDDYYLNPMVNINSEYASMTLSPLLGDERIFNSYKRDFLGNYTLQASIDLLRYPFDDLEAVTEHTIYNPYYIQDEDPYFISGNWTGGADSDSSGFNYNTYMTNDSECFCPDYLVGTFNYFNSCELENPYGSMVDPEGHSLFDKYNSDTIQENLGYLWGRSYISNLYELYHKIELLKNDILDFCKVIDWKNLGLWFYMDALESVGYNVEHYVDELYALDTSLGWELKGRYINGILYVILSRGDVERWYDSDSRFLFELILPTGDYVSHRLYGGYYFYYLVGIGSTSYLYKYSFQTGHKQEFELPNTYGGNYELVNRQLLGERYIFARTGNYSTCVFIDIQNPSNIKYSVNMNVDVEVGYRVIPNFVRIESGSSYCPYLLELCNKLRAKHGIKKMYWSARQAMVAQNHATWCANNGVFSHTGSGNSDPEQRNKEAGIYMGVGENISQVFKSNSEREQLDAFTNWIGSPHHLANIMTSSYFLMSFGSATYPSSITEIQVDAGMWDPISQSYTTESSVVQIPEIYRGKLKIYVQNFISY